jgi:hypothetical protein
MPKLRQQWKRLGSKELGIFEEPNPKLNLGPAVPIKKAVNDKIKTLRSLLNRFTMMPALNCFRTFNP